MSIRLPNGTSPRKPPADADITVTSLLSSYCIHPLALTIDDERGVVADLTANDMGIVVCSVLPDACADGWVTVFEVGPRLCWELPAVVDGYRVTLRYHSERLPPGGVVVGYWPDALAKSGAA